MPGWVVGRIPGMRATSFLRVHILVLSASSLHEFYVALALSLFSFSLKYYSLVSPLF
jgi:hypothetical protein